MRSECAEKRCPHGLSPFTSEFESAAVYGGSDANSFCTNDINELGNYLRSLGPCWFVGQCFKFDLNYLYHKGLELPTDQWLHDTQAMAVSFTQKVPEDYLQDYEEKRREVNKSLPVKNRLRKGSTHSLKVLAPYFLDVPPFWEALGHDSDDYVMLDAKYTYELAKFFIPKLQAEGTFDFYQNKLMPWTKMIMKMEREGVRLDLGSINVLRAESATRENEQAAELHKLWADADKAWYNAQSQGLSGKYLEMRNIAIKKWEDKKGEISKEKEAALIKKYDDLCIKATYKLPTKLSLTSNKDILWLARDYFGLDATTVTGKESVDESVLTALAEKEPGFQKLLEFRKNSKLLSTYYTNYEKMQKDGRIYCSFNIDVTRTGRLSSSGPNLQNVPGMLHKLFIAEPGNLFATFDESSIEARLIGYYTEDPILLDIIFSGTDFHGHNAKLYFSDITCHADEVKEKHPIARKFAKTLGYALFYGAGKGRVEETAKKFGFDWPEEKCKEVVERFRTEYTTVMQFKKMLDTMVKAEPVMNMFGRKHFYANHEDIYMKNFNRLIQSSASDLVLLSAQRIAEHDWMKPRLLVHDEIVTELPESRKDEGVEIIKHCMTDYKLPTHRGNIPLEVEGRVMPYWEKE